MLWTPPTTLANLATGLPVPVRCPYFDFCFGFLWDLNDWLPSGELLVLRRRVVAALDEESSVVSCGNDVGDVRAVECKNWLIILGQRSVQSLQRGIGFVCHF